MDTVYKGAVLVFCFMKSLIWNLVVLTFHHKKYFHLRQNLPWLRFKNSHQSGDSDSFRNWPNRSLGRYISGHHLTPKSFSGEFNYFSITTQITGWLSKSFNIGISWGPLVKWIPNDAVVHTALLGIDREPGLTCLSLLGLGERVVWTWWSIHRSNSKTMILSEQTSIFLSSAINRYTLQNVIYIDLDSPQVNSAVVTQCSSLYKFCFVLNPLPISCFTVV